jgi:hypothetical protein
MADAAAESLAVWDVPMPVVAGEMFSIKVGVTSAAGRVEVCDSAGAVVASGTLNETVYPQTALYWTALDVPAPARPEVAKYMVRCAGAETWFSVIASAKPEHRLLVQVSERDSKAMLDGVEIRLGPFHARTDKAGRAELLVCNGEYQLQLWRTAHIAAPTPVTIDGDMSVALMMTHVPEDHPDARWVR